MSTTDISVVGLTTEFIAYGTSFVAWLLPVLNSVVHPTTELGALGAQALVTLTPLNLAVAFDFTFLCLYLAVWHWSLPLPLDLNSLPQSRAEGGFRRIFEKTPKYPCSTKSLPKGSQVGRPVKISNNAKKCRKASNNCHDTSVTHFWGVLGHFIFLGKFRKIAYLEKRPFAACHEFVLGMRDFTV